MSKRQFVAVSRMVIDGKVKQPGAAFTADDDDPTVRGWLRAGNIKHKTKPAKKKVT